MRAWVGIVALVVSGAAENVELMLADIVVAAIEGAGVIIIAIGFIDAAAWLLLLIARPTVTGVHGAEVVVIAVRITLTAQACWSADAFTRRGVAGVCCTGVSVIANGIHMEAPVERITRILRAGIRVVAVGEVEVAGAADVAGALNTRVSAHAFGVGLTALSKDGDVLAA